MSHAGWPDLAFAYGSLLDPTTWRDPERPHREVADVLEPFGRAWLPDHAPAFHYHSSAWGGQGALDVAPRAGAVAPGMLFRLAPGGIERLDAREGHPRLYRRQVVTVLDERGLELSAVTWRVSEARRRVYHVPPRADYLGACLVGYARWGLADEGPLRAAAAGRPVPPVDLLAVYGSLRVGGRAHGLLADRGARRLCTLRLPGRLHDCGAWPAAVLRPEEPGVLAPCPEEPGVVVEIFRLAEPLADLALLDRYEGFHGWGRADNLFRRAVVELPRSAPEVGGRTCWIYVAADPRLCGPTVPGGDWLAR